jgi:GT2 family glycosyltransferase
MREVEGFDPDYGEAQDYDLLLKCSERLKPSQIRHIPAALYCRTGLPQVLPKGKGYERAVVASLTRQGIAAEVLPGEAEGVLRICYPTPEPPPLVSIIILTRDRLDLLQRCVESILAKTDYPSYEIIVVDNGSQEPETLDYLCILEQKGSARIIRDDRPFNFSALNNIAIRQAFGQYIATLNNDMEVIGDQWLKEMVSHACRPGVGAVGARLWFPDDTLQHGGVIFVKGSALHAHRGAVRGSSGYWGRAVAIQNFSAVTAACLVMRKEIYLKAGGMNEADLSVSYNDIDLCLKLSVAGYRIVWTPYAELYHYESASRGDDLSSENRKRALAEYAYMVRRWGAILESDPAWNPEITSP